ncbi:cytidine deaminase [Streptomyces sp. SS]|uniref:cytidine deaminase n=1 Tax=Streptomyces sp. SS TaxID=260742 RepID=UPI000325AA84|nr:cytidine deaminase [Streptomyces sp. SS]
MKLDQALVDAAIAQLETRWTPDEPGGAAAVYLDDGRILTSVALDNINAGVTLCQETGAFCQAYTLDRRVTASVCVFRAPDDGRFVVLPPCGICQERLALWGPDVEVGVPDPDDPTRWQARTLAEMNPYYWACHFANGAWPSQELHAG